MSNAEDGAQLLRDEQVQNPVVAENLQDLEKFDLHYNLMTKYDPNESYNDIQFFSTQLRRDNLSKFQRKTM